MPESPRDFLNDFGTLKLNKVYTNVCGKNGKVAYVSKKRVSLQDYKHEYGSAVKVLSDDDIKKRHLGKVKCVMRFKDDEELKSILTMYFESK